MNGSWLHLTEVKMFKVEAQSFEQRGEHLEISKFQFKDRIPVFGYAHGILQLSNSS